MIISRTKHMLDVGRQGLNGNDGKLKTMIFKNVNHELILFASLAMAVKKKSNGDFWPWLSSVI